MTTPLSPITELSVPLDYSDLKKVNFFSRAFGLDFKITEGESIYTIVVVIIILNRSSYFICVLTPK